MFKLVHPVVDIGVICSNFEKSFHFYHDLLGMEVAIEAYIPGEFTRKIKLTPDGFRQVRLQAGETLIKLAEMQSPPPTPPDEFRAGVRWLTFHVEDMKTAVDELKRRGVQFLTEPAASPDAAAVVLTRDPDGILIELVQH